MAFSVLRRATLCAGLALALLVPQAASAGELLQNGGFEQGTSGWNGSGLSTTGCGPRSGNSALSVPNFAQQTLPTPVGSGTYILTGWTKAAGASASIEIDFIWYDVNGSQIAVLTEDHTAGANYGHFSFSATRPAGAHGLRLRISASGGTVCLDDLSLDGPPTAPPATATATPAQQPTAPAGTTPVSGTPRPSATPRPTSTPRPSATPARASTADAPPPPSYSITNGGFEDGLSGWSKFGGTLELAHSPVRSGVQAGRLVSSTNSTKWAYQVVLIDPSRSYEFGGYVAAGAGISSAYLRLSWYAAGDGSGQQLSTTDSTESLSAGSGYVYLTTGAVGPPPEAHSARARVVMTPLGAGAASIVFDDLWFAEAAPAPSQPQPEPAADEPTEASAGTNAVAAARAQPEPQPDEEPYRAPTEVRAAAIGPAPTVLPLPSGPLRRQEESRGIPLIWLAAAAGAAIIGAAGYLQGKRRAV